MKPSRRPHKPSLQCALDTLRPWLLVIKAFEDADAENTLPAVYSFYAALWDSVARTLDHINAQAGDTSFNLWIDASPQGEKL